MSHQCVTRWYPRQKDTFTKGGDAWKALNAGRQVTVDGRGFIMEVWDPRTKKLYDRYGDEIGTKDEASKEAAGRSVRVTSGTIYTPDNRDEFIKGSDTWNALDAGRNVVLDSRGRIIEIRNPVTGELYDVLGVGETPFPESYDKETKTLLTATYIHEDADTFAEGGDAWEALTISPDMQMTLDHQGFMIDIWDSKTGNLYDHFGHIIGTRKDPYPSDTNIDDLLVETRRLLGQINALRQRTRGQHSYQHLTHSTYHYP